MINFKSPQMDTFLSLQRTIQEDPHIQKLPPFLNEMVDIFRKGHLYYRAYKMQAHGQAFKDSSQGNPIVYGAALHLLADYTSIGSYAINVALITKCAQDLLQEYRQLSESYQTLSHAFKWQYPLYQPIEWKQNSTHRQNVFSPSFHFWWHRQVLGLARQVLKIIRCALQVFWQAFKFSMCLCDAYLLLNGDSQMHYEACTELVAKWTHYQHLLKENKERLIEAIRQGGELADRLLVCLGANKSRLFIIDQLKQTMESLTRKTGKTLDKLSDAAEQTLDSIYVKGKITPLHINLAAGKQTPSALPYGRFPPWAGQQMTLVNSKPTRSPLEATEHFLLNNIEFPFEETWKDISWLANRLNHFYQNQKKASTPASPFV